VEELHQAHEVLLLLADPRIHRGPSVVDGERGSRDDMGFSHRLRYPHRAAGDNQAVADSLAGEGAVTDDDRMADQFTLDRAPAEDHAAPETLTLGGTPDPLRGQNQGGRVVAVQVVVPAPHRGDERHIPGAGVVEGHLGPTGDESWVVALF